MNTSKKLKVKSFLILEGLDEFVDHTGRIPDYHYQEAVKIIVKNNLGSATQNIESEILRLSSELFYDSNKSFTVINEETGEVETHYKPMKLKPSTQLVGMTNLYWAV